MSLIALVLSFFASIVPLALSAPYPDGQATPTTGDLGFGPSCFPALGFQMPILLPWTNAQGWWCDPSTEYAFMGFSYEVTDCGSIPKPISIDQTLNLAFSLSLSLRQVKAQSS